MNIDQLANETLQLGPKGQAILAETIWESLKIHMLCHRICLMKSRYGWLNKETMRLKTVK